VEYQEKNRNKTDNGKLNVFVITPDETAVAEGIYELAL